MINPTNVSKKIDNTTNSNKILTQEFKILYEKAVNKNYPIRKIGISFSNIKDEYFEEYNLFVDKEKINEERKIQDAFIKVQKKYGKNTILKGYNLLDKATTVKRNTLIGGHNAK